MANLSYEAEVLPGLKPFALEELRRCFQRAITFYAGDDPDCIRFHFTGPPRDLLALRTVVAVYAAEHFAIPRPRALLGHAHLSRLLDAIERLRSLHPPDAFHTFRISAAGSGSTTFSRLIGELANRTGLVHQPDEADLLLRVRPSAFKREGWEVLIRLSPRPLSARSWRVCDMPGALNATIAAAMVELTRPSPADCFLNLMCGSGTLLIERLLRRPAARTVGCDIDINALRCARENIAASGLSAMVELINMDATRLEYPDGTFNVLCVDLPWGQLSGTHIENVSLYSAVLTEAARVSTAGAWLAAITHEVKLFESLLPEVAFLWEVQDVIKVLQGGLHPRIYALRRK